MAGWKSDWANKKDAAAALAERFKGLDAAQVHTAILELRTELEEADARLHDYGGQRAAAAVELEWLEEHYESLTGRPAP